METCTKHPGVELEKTAEDSKYHGVEICPESQRIGYLAAKASLTP